MSNAPGDRRVPWLLVMTAALLVGACAGAAEEGSELEDRFWRSQALFEARYGKPVDRACWQANNPASIVVDRTAAIRDGGLEISPEVGDRLPSRLLYAFAALDQALAPPPADRSLAPLPADYAESVAVYALTPDGGTEVRFRLARQPATGRGTLWMSMMVGGEHYALVDPAIELGPSAAATPLTAAAAVFRVADGESIEVATRDRQGDTMSGRVTVAAALHATRHPPVGGGANPITLEVDFAAAHAVQSPRPGRREVFGAARWRVTTPAAVFEGHGPAKWHEQSGPRPAFAPAFTYFWGAAPGVGLLARGGAGADWGFLVEEGVVTDVDELTIDPLGAESRQFTVRLADGRTVAGTATVLRKSSVPIEGGRRPSATVHVDSTLGSLIGHLNDWRPPRDADE